MTENKYSIVIKILDDQNRLTDRADTKAISLLTTLGIFSVLFIAQLNNINDVGPFTIFLLIVYCMSIILAVTHIILAIVPRIHTIKDIGKPANKIFTAQPTFFGGICKFPDAVAYEKCIDDITNSGEIINTIYVRQVYEIARINKTKYLFIGRAVWFVVISLLSQIAFIVFVFAQKLG